MFVVEMKKVANKAIHKRIRGIANPLPTGQNLKKDSIYV